jgi:hypothetical protein
VAGEIEYTFRHLLVRDVAYGQIPRVERAGGHRRAAEWIGALGRPEDHSETLAHHYAQALELGELAGLDRGEFSSAARTAFADAGDRAFALNAYPVAARHYRAALDLLPERDAHRGPLVARLGRSLLRLEEVDVPLLESGVAQARAAGDLESAAEIERTLWEYCWIAGDRDEAFRHLDAALALVGALPPSPAKAATLEAASRLRMLAADYLEAIRLGRQALAMAEQLGLEGLRAAVLTDVGSSRPGVGEVEEGLADMARAAEVAAAGNAPYELVRAKNNRAANLWVEGRLAEAIGLSDEASEEAKRYGQSQFVRWFRAAIPGNDYELGRWDDALDGATAFIGEVEAGSPHYLTSRLYAVRALVRLARDQSVGIIADAEQGVALARRAKDPQNLFLALADAAHIHSQTGHDETAGELAGEFMAAVAAGRPLGFAVSWVHILAWTATEVGRGPDLVNALSQLRQVPCVRAAIAFAEGDPLGAAEICAEMGAVTQEAYARLAAANDLVRHGRRAEADEQLQRALAFYRSVGATRYVREGEALLAASA